MTSLAANGQHLTKESRTGFPLGRCHASLASLGSVRRGLRKFQASRPRPPSRDLSGWNSQPKQVWRAQAVLLGADGIGANAVMRAAGISSKSCAWRWQQRLTEAGTDGVLADNIRPSRISPPDTTLVERAAALTVAEPPGESHAPDSYRRGLYGQRPSGAPYLAQPRPAAA